MIAAASLGPSRLPTRAMSAAADAAHTIRRKRAGCAPPDEAMPA